MSDGKSNGDGKDKIPSLASTIRASGVVIFTIGIADINADELLAVASSKQHMYVLSDFDKLKQLNDRLQRGEYHFSKCVVYLREIDIVLITSRILFIKIS